MAGMGPARDAKRIWSRLIRASRAERATTAAMSGFFMRGRREYMNMIMSQHALERWDQRCFGLSIESEWIQAERMDKKTLMGLKETSPAHRHLIRNNHDKYFYLVSKQSLTVWVCKQGDKGKSHWVVTVWRLGYSKERSSIPVPDGWFVEPWHDVVTKTSGWRFRSKQTGWASSVHNKFMSALKNLNHHVQQVEMNKRGQS